eukprot:CAMPEP_0172725814 /NCGR_PEP_ID=MMETSP1074-20121228/89360_1 /TAXON_ID=2916 /ORGANISM="Ceratium fusus, Strain PA161109" /LENGTH=110 /DNA_ID=CAMNT_0013552679 /DNA_START=643 /DNA_END=972 /DNA_ORIENTATION=-
MAVSSWAFAAQQVVLESQWPSLRHLRSVQKTKTRKQPGPAHWHLGRAVSAVVSPHRQEWAATLEVDQHLGHNPSLSLNRNHMKTQPLTVVYPSASKHFGGLLHMENLGDA